MTSNNLQYEIDFHAEVNSQKNEKVNLLSANEVSLYVTCVKYRVPFSELAWGT